MKSSNTAWQHATINRAKKAVILWFTSLSGAGKSTLAHGVDERLHQMPCSSFMLDGDNIRHGLCGDLGFSDADRHENIRRVAEVAKLMLESGLILLTTFISPFQSERLTALRKVPHGRFSGNLLTIQSGYSRATRRQGPVYRKVREGLMSQFNGISWPYEAPPSLELTVGTGNSALM